MDIRPHLPKDFKADFVFFKTPGDRLWLSLWKHILAGVIVTVFSAFTALAQPAKPSSGLMLIQAVETTLSRQPNILLEKETVRLNEGIFQEEKGLFDPLFSVSGGQSRTDQPLPKGSTGSHKTTDMTSLEFSVAKSLRNGAILKPTVSVNRTRDPILYDSVQNFATVSFKLIVPLLRGRGETATAGREKAAGKTHAASLLQLRHTTARLTLETVVSYWNYVAAVIRLEELKKSESETEGYVRMMKSLIDGGERPGADLQQVVANYEAKVALRIAGEQALQEARQKLGLAMGLSFEEIERLARPADPLPSVPDSFPKNLTLTPLVEQAIVRRTDYLASKEALEAAHILLEAERNGRLPFLDLELSAGYSGLDEGRGAARFVNSLAKNIPGPNASAMLTYRWPVGNNAVQGRILQRDSAYRQAKIGSEDLSRRIGSSLALTLSTVKNTIAESSRIRQSVLTYEKALANEQKKVRLGWSTFLDLMVMQDRLHDAIQSEVSASLRYAEALARLRFEVGLLLAGEGERADVRMEDLTTLPQDYDRDKKDKKDRP